jgi:hypothetical protein
VLVWHHTSWEAVGISLESQIVDDGDLMVLGVHAL